MEKKKQRYTISYRKNGKPYSQTINTFNIQLAIGIVKMREGNIELTGGVIENEATKRHNNK